MTNNNTLVIDDNETLLRSLAEFLKCLDSSVRARTNQVQTDAAVNRVSFALTCHKRESHDCSSLERLEAIPSFLTGMVVARVERAAREMGQECVPPELMQKVRARSPIGAGLGSRLRGGL